MTGFDDNEAAWDEEYRLLCKAWRISSPVGFSREAFTALVNEDSERGCYCSDEELLSVVCRLCPSTASHTTGNNAASTAVTETAALNQGTGCANTAGANSETGFWEVDSVPTLELQVPSNGGTELHCGMKRGFQEDGRREPVLSGTIGIVDCSDEAEVSKSSCLDPCVDTGMSSSRVQTPNQAAMMIPAQETGFRRGKFRKQPRPPRPCVLESLFDALDLNGDGLLSKSELKTFAELSGFSGSDADWNDEYQLLCKEWRCSPCDGVSKAIFTLVNDTSDVGCFCDDRTIWDIHQAVGGRLEAG
eukprot:CAMPEP_0179140838 /NCGR_PEP_ID=MMETSP0796-20121207/67484_1 /TAXON_ID=73915 /ORGANISM="Pyrodinium bahamense, Strain pbaha01" /LENGTH=302 /DNA_ID=CAMNT_0020840457 /DNA_START=17 /DNA_END=922 /DNA_ORIENTATION=+